MDHGITKITYDKTTEKDQSITTHYQPENHEKSTGDNNAWNRRHHKSLFVFRIFMMYSVNEVMETLSPFCIIHKVKNIPVKDVFEKSPAKKPNEENADKRYSTRLYIVVKVP